MSVALIMAGIVAFCTVALTVLQIGAAGMSDNIEESRAAGGGILATILVGGAATAALIALHYHHGALSW